MRKITPRREQNTRTKSILNFNKDVNAFQRGNVGTPKTKQKTFLPSSSIGAKTLNPFTSSPSLNDNTEERSRWKFTSKSSPHHTTIPIDVFCVRPPLVHLASGKHDFLSLWPLYNSFPLWRGFVWTRFWDYGYKTRRHCGTRQGAKIGPKR